MNAPAGILTAEVPQASPPAGGWRDMWKHAAYVASDNPVTLGAFLLFAFFVFLAIFGPWIVPYSPLATDTVAVYALP